MNKRKNISKKWLAAIMVFSLMLCSLTGCMGEQVGITFNSDGTCSYTVKYLLEESAYSYLAVTGDTEELFFMSGDYQTAKETINGNTYQSYSRTFSFHSYEEMKTFLTNNDTYISTLKSNSVNPKVYDDLGEVTPFSSLTMDASGFTAQINMEGELALFSDDSGESISELQEAGYTSQSDYYSSLGMLLDISVTLPSPIVESNGVVSGNMVSWNMSNVPIDGKLIAATAGNPISSDIEPPAISGVKENKKYREVTIIASDNVWLKALTVDGVNKTANKILVTEHGKHTVVATDGNNNTTTIHFQIDAKAPKIKGAKNGKTYKKPVTLRFSDDAGIKKVLVNDKKIKSKKKVKLKKPGIYVVYAYDKCGNVNYKYFKIKKKK